MFMLMIALSGFLLEKFMLSISFYIFSSFSNSKINRLFTCKYQKSYSKAWPIGIRINSIYKREKLYEKDKSQVLKSSIV